ncbi:MAG: hypothetical protein IT477_07490 [Rhodanobacteraceae bacterium]|nr:hypothetical protein [Rhodanobacteraceae bacterium]
MHASHGGILVALGALLALAPAAAALELAARDARTGAPVAATLDYDDGKPRRASIDGHLRAIAAPALRVTATAQAAGYRALEFTLDPAGGPTTLLLDPLHEPAAYARLAARVAARGDERWLQGYVRRIADGAPLAAARITLEGRDMHSLDDGYFQLQLAPCPRDATRRSTLRLELPGVGEQEHVGLACADGVQRMLLTLGAGAPTRVDHVVGALDRGARSVAGEASTPSSVLQTALPTGPLLAPALAPPASIRVGYADAACSQSCCTGSCTHSCVLPLETYVRRGLDNEWIASWHSQSLRAGSVAYRSYGAWRVAHPIRPNFDICSSACCQVNDGSTHGSTDSAIARTPGLMLTRSGSEAASSEYSAENNSWDDPGDGLSCSNNDLSCGDGYAGSPANGWPCLADSVGAGRGCFGHGRGMSQWGTQRWALTASAPSWRWIVDHYYNDNGAGSNLRTAVMTSPLALSDLAATPAVIAPGATLQIDATASNSAGASHAHLLIGASLYRAGVGYLDDSAHDAPLELAGGSHPVTRSFSVPAGAPAGSYDLLVSLYLDVDENGAISSTDLALALASASGAVQVGNDRIFSDGFESDP